MDKHVSPEKALAITSYHFHPRWTLSYGEDTKNAFEEFEDVVKAGYFNCIIVERTYLNDDEFWRIIFENDCSVWLNIYDSFYSDKISFEDWIEPFDVELSKLRETPERWERLMGFHFDEPIWRGQSNNDFLYETEKLTEMYGKRIFPVFATGEFCDSEGNAMQLNMDAHDMRRVNPAALKYVTDVAFDSYSVDVRDGYSNGDYIDKMHKMFNSIVDGKTYYSVLTEHLVSLVGHDVNVWFFPCAWITNKWGGGSVDEDYCIAHLEFFKELLTKQKNKGGIVLYTYKNGYRDNPDLYGMQSLFVVKDENGNQKLRPEVLEKWERYSELTKQIAEEYKCTEARLK